MLRVTTQANRVVPRASFHVTRPGRARERRSARPEAGLVIFVARLVRGATPGEALHVVERYTRTGPDHIQYEVTIEDPEVFTRSWRIAMPLYRRLEPNIQLVDYPCIEFAEEFLYGHVRKEQLVKRWEGETMIVDITRKVPPEDRFYEWYRK